MNSVDYFYRKSDYILTEGHEEMGHHEDHADEDHADEDHADEDHSDEDHGDEHHEDEHDGHGHGESTVFSSESDEFGATFDLSTDALAQKVAVNVLSEEVSIIGSEAFMNPSESDEVTLGYYASTEIGQFTVDFGARFDFIDREGSLSHEEEHHDDEDHGDEDHGDEDHGDEHHDEEHEMEYYSRSDNNTSLSMSLSNEITDSLSFTLGISNVERTPSSIELFMNGAHMATGRYEVGDVNLKSETSRNIDLSFVYEQDGYFGNLSFFRNDVDNYIYLQDETEEEHEEHEDEHDHGGLIRADYLQGDALLEGYELEIGRSFALGSGELELSFARDALKAEFASGGYLPRITPPRNIFAARYTQDTLDLKMSFKDVESQKDTGVGEMVTDGYQMLNLNMTKSFVFSDTERLSVTVFAKNLLDEIARNHASFVKDEVPLPGRNIGLRVNFQYN